MALLRTLKARAAFNRRVLAWRQANRIEQAAVWFYLGYLTHSEDPR